LRCGHSEGHHGHPSQGSFTIDAYGDLLSQAPGYNLWGRNTKAYNLIEIDGQGQADDHTNSRNVNDGHIERFVHSSVADLCIANNKPAYDGKGNRVQRSLRYLLFVRRPKRRGYLVVVDDMDKDGREHEYTWHFHTTPNHVIEPDTEHGFIARGLSRDEVIDLWGKRGEEKGLQGLSLGGKPDGGWYAYRWPGPSKRYPWVKEVKVDLRLSFIWPERFSHKVAFKAPRWRGSKEFMNVPDHLQLTQRSAAALFFTVLYPERADHGVKMPRVERVIEDGLWGAKLGEDTILFSRRDGIWKHGDIETDARLVYVRRSEAGKVTGFSIGEATVLKVGGKQIFESSKRVTAAGSEPEVVIDDGGEWRATSAKRGMPG
jgi:hypothetical protein